LLEKWSKMQLKIGYTQILKNILQFTNNITKVYIRFEITNFVQCIYSQFSANSCLRTLSLWLWFSAWFAQDSDAQRQVSSGWSTRQKWRTTRRRNPFAARSLPQHPLGELTSQTSSWISWKVLRGRVTVWGMGWEEGGNSEEFRGKEQKRVRERGVYVIGLRVTGTPETCSQKNNESMNIHKKIENTIITVTDNRGTLSTRRTESVQPAHTTPTTSWHKINAVNQPSIFGAKPHCTFAGVHSRRVFAAGCDGLISRCWCCSQLMSSIRRMLLLLLLMLLLLGWKVERWRPRS